MLLIFLVGLRHFLGQMRIRWNTKNKCQELPTLPGPVLDNIFSFLNPSDLASCRQTCRLWNRIISYYDLLPASADFYFHADGLQTIMPPPPSSSQDSSILSFLKPKKRKGPAELLEAAQWLQEQFVQDQPLYITKSMTRMRLVGVEDFLTGRGVGLADPNQFLIQDFIPIMDSVSFMEIAAKDFDKLEEVCTSGLGGAQEFRTLLHGLPNLTQLSIPFHLVCSTFCDSLLTGETLDFLSEVESLEIILPDTETILNNKSVYVCAFEILKSFILNCPGLKSLKIATNNQRKKKQQWSDVISSLAKMSETFQEFEGDFSQLFVEISEWEWKCSIQNLELQVDFFPISAIIFQEVQKTSLVVVLLLNLVKVEGLKTLRLRVEGHNIIDSLLYIGEILHAAGGCQTYLDIVLYFDETLNSHNQYLLSLPELSTTIKTFTCTFLPGCSPVSLMDILPFYIQLDPLKGQVSFPNMTSLHIVLLNSKVSLGCSRYLSHICPQLKELSVIIGEKEVYSSFGRMIWSLYKQGSWWLGWPGSETLMNVLFVGGILRFMPQLESLSFWGDLRHAEDDLFIDERAGVEDFILAKEVPKLKKLSLRGLGWGVTNRSLEGFMGMKRLTHLELIGMHRISNSARTKLMKEVPSLHEVKFRF